MLTPFLPLPHQTMAAKRGQMLRDAGRRQIERVGDAGHILFAQPQLFDEAYAIGMGKNLEQVRHFFRHDDTAGNDRLLCTYAKL